jgi:hypothetical protein
MLVWAAIDCVGGTSPVGLPELELLALLELLPHAANNSASAAVKMTAERARRDRFVGSFLMVSPQGKFR